MPVQTGNHRELNRTEIDGEDPALDHFYYIPDQPLAAHQNALRPGGKDCQLFAGHRTADPADHHHDRAECIWDLRFELLVCHPWIDRPGHYAALSYPLSSVDPQQRMEEVGSAAHHSIPGCPGRQADGRHVR